MINQVGGHSRKHIFYFYMPPFRTPRVNDEAFVGGGNKHSFSHTINQHQAPWRPFFIAIFRNMDGFWGHVRLVESCVKKDNQYLFSISPHRMNSESFDTLKWLSTCRLIPICHSTDYGVLCCPDVNYSNIFCN